MRFLKTMALTIALAFGLNGMVYASADDIQPGDPAYTPFACNLEAMQRFAAAAERSGPEAGDLFMLEMDKRNCNTFFPNLPGTFTKKISRHTDFSGKVFDVWQITPDYDIGFDPHWWVRVE